MIKKISIVALVLVVSFISCDNIVENRRLPDNEHKVTIDQGVWGNVWFWEGNFMPAIGGSSGGKITPVVREIHVYEATKHNEVVYSFTSFPFIRDINSTLIQKVISDKDGFFQVRLDVGEYSFFVKEDSLYYANGTNSNGFLVSAEVRENMVVKRQIDINYKAAY